MNNIRIVCEAKCTLRFDGFNLKGVIKNISLSGALIELNDTVPNSIHPGDKCNLMLGTNPNIATIMYSSEVIRTGSNIIGIRFHELNIVQD